MMNICIVLWFSFSTFSLYIPHIFGVPDEEIIIKYPKRQWENGLGKSWYHTSNNEWKEFINETPVKTFHYVQTINPNDEAVIIQQRGYHPLVLDKNFAYYDGNIFATGNWNTLKHEWVGQRSDNSGSAKFLRDGASWSEYKNGHYLKTFRHIQVIESETFAVVLQQWGLWAFVLTDTAAYYEGNLGETGQWMTTGNWYGQRSDGRSSSFKRKSPTSWFEYDNGTYLKTFEHIQTLKPGAKAVVLQQDGLKPLIIDKDRAYYNGRAFADGFWESDGSWFGDRHHGGTVKFVYRGSTWDEYKNGNYLKAFHHIQWIPAGRAAVVMQQGGFWPIVIDDVSASYRGDSFATGFWNSEVVISSPLERLRRSLSPTCDAVCQIREDRGNNVRAVLYIRESNGRITTPRSRREWSDSMNAIAALMAERVDREQREIVREEGSTVRIDNQHGMNLYGERYVNLQVQTNGPESVTLAQASVPVRCIIIREVRRALLYSLDESRFVTLVYVRRS